AGAGASRVAGRRQTRSATYPLDQAAGHEGIARRGDEVVRRLDQHARAVWLDVAHSGDGRELARRDVDRYRRLGRHRHPAVLAWAAAVARPAPAAARTRSRSAAVSVVAGIAGIAE